MEQKIEDKKIHKSRTVQFNVIYTIIAIAALLMNYIPEEYVPLLAVVQGVGNVILRVWFTSQPITLKNK
jgi:Mg2+/citrate symporter